MAAAVVVGEDREWRIEEYQCFGEEKVVGLWEFDTCTI